MAIAVVLYIIALYSKLVLDLLLIMNSLNFLNGIQCVRSIFPITQFYLMPEKKMFLKKLHGEWVYIVVGNKYNTTTREQNKWIDTLPCWCSVGGLLVCYFPIKYTKPIINLNKKKIYCNHNKFASHYFYFYVKFVKAIQLYRNIILKQIGDLS